VWESEDGENYAPVSSGVNTLGVVPIDWYLPGEQTDDTPGLTAMPTLDDLAQMNLAYWQAYSNHMGLMEHVRSPGWVINGVDWPKDPNGRPVITFAPGVFLAGMDSSVTVRVESVGVDPASVANSFQDLRLMEDNMAAYNLALVLPQKAQITATQIQISAASSNSALRGWVAKLQDAMENALRKIALWIDEQDGPALFINDEFVLPFDSSALQQISGMVDRAQAPMFVLYESMKKMGLVGEDMTYEQYMELIASDVERRNASMMQQYTPSFGDGLNGERSQQE
jgi:hypothetical protein